LSIQRADNTVPLKYCNAAFDNIISQCIEGEGLWAGYYAYDGETYNISNSRFPGYTLLHEDNIGTGDKAPTENAAGGSCDLPKSEADTFSKSGAAQYLQGFLAKNGDDNWLVAMERATITSQGTADEPSCGIIESMSCYPFKDCRQFTPTEFYYVRLVSGLINQFFTRAHEKLQDESIRNIVSINEIIDDFKPDPNSKLNGDFFKDGGGGLSVADKIVKLGQEKDFGPLGDLLGFFGAVVGIVALNIPSDPDLVDIEAVRNEAAGYIKKVFDETNNAMTNILARLFGDKKVDYSLSNLIDNMKKMGFKPAADNWDPTAITMSMGWMGKSESLDLSGALTSGLKQINQGLVGSILKAMGRMVIVFKDFDQGKCSMPGSQWIDNQCYMVSKGWEGKYCVYG
ncbi:hypothetical protein BGZ63DRAFT_446273, partial [Mariannaea sp. PMI_226]